MTKSLCRELLVRAVIIGLGWCVSSDAARAQWREIRFDHKSLSINQQNTLLHILHAEDQRIIDDRLLNLLNDSDPHLRRRVAIALGRIGEFSAVAPLASLLEKEHDSQVRDAIVFGIGEIEAPEGIAALRQALHRAEEQAPVRARAVEALGKIAAALSATQHAAELRIIESEIIKTLSDESDRAVTLAAITAALRARLSGAGATIAKFLRSDDARVRADAANTLARLRIKAATAELEKLLADSDAVVRANAARALGAAESRASAEKLGNMLAKEPDERVRVSAIRALGAVGDQNAAPKLLAHAEPLVAIYRRRRMLGGAHPPEINELLEIVGALGRLANQSSASQSLRLIKELRAGGQITAPEIEIAYVRIAAPEYVRDISAVLSTRRTAASPKPFAWQSVSAIGQGLGEIAQMTPAETSPEMRAAIVRALAVMLDDPATPMLAVPDLLRAFAAFNTAEASDVFARHLQSPEVIVRATAAELLGTLPPSEKHAQLLAANLRPALSDSMNDAALAILDALGRQKNEPSAQQAIRTVLGARDHLVRRRAALALRASGDDSPTSIGAVETSNTTTDYKRALARGARRVMARVATDKGSFSIALLPREAPLTVDNFIKLARRGFFNNLTFHRVVPNFVIQGGDPRGDGNGGPHYQIRCEINEVPYERGIIGMALSGKDTGGSQWFVTHAPQPHLDGGYTVFGRIIEGMSTVDAIARGDRIRRVTIVESDASKRSPRAPVKLPRNSLLRVQRETNPFN